MASLAGLLVDFGDPGWQSAERPPVGASLAMVLEGMRYIWRNKLILGTISLDLFAVLLGGAVALLPVYARDILNIGASGLGLLRSAPGVGAVIDGDRGGPLAAAAARRRQDAGLRVRVRRLHHRLRAFAQPVVSLAALVLLGALDMVSVIVRQTMVQLATPDEMRGRVSAVNSVFIGASNEVGQFESGLTAQWFGTVPAVVLGGVGTMLWCCCGRGCFPRCGGSTICTRRRPPRIDSQRRSRVHMKYGIRQSRIEPA